MKFLLSQLAYLTSEREARANLRALAKYFAFLALLTWLGVQFVAFGWRSVRSEYPVRSASSIRRTGRARPSRQVNTGRWP